jgi:hypothetical protein
MSYLLASDIISGIEGTVWATIDGQVVECAEVRNLTATMDKNKTEVRTLGNRATQHKATGWRGSGSFTFYYVTTRWAKMLIDYAKTGKDLYFDIVVKNEDPTSTVGSQKIKLGQCNIDGGDIAKVDVDADLLDTSVNFTFSQVDVLEQFKPYNAAQ